MIIVDAHQDIAYNALCFGRDYRRSALKKRQLEVAGQAAALQHNGYPTIGLPEALVGRVALVFATLFVAPKSKRAAPWDALTYTTPQEAEALALRQLDYYERIIDEDERLLWVRTAAELDTVLATWEPDQPLTGRRQGLVLLMENADPILEPQRVEEWVERGVRLIGPAWRGTRYTGGTGEPGPLTDLGRDLLDVMQNAGIVLDLSHMAEEAYFQALEQYAGPVIASHSNPRQFADTDRHLSDKMIRDLAERDGVMGVAFYNRFLDDRWRSTDRKKAITLARVADVIDYVCQLTGSANHVGIGTDFDGGFGAESVPDEVDTVGDLWQLKAILERRGFSAEDTRAVLGGNMLRKLRQGLPT